MDRRTVAPLALLGVLAASALAQEPAPTYDLRVRYAYRVGDRVRVEERFETQLKAKIRTGTKVHQSVDQVQGYEQRYEEEVQAVSPTGEVTRSVRSYTYAKVLSADEALDLKDQPLRVQFSVDEEGAASFAPVDSGVVIPEVLQVVLDEDTGKQENEEEMERRRRLILPEQPLPVGGTWTVPLEKVCEVFDYEPEQQVAAEGYEARGVLEAAEPEGGATFLRAALTLELPLRELEGMPCPTPVAVHTVVRMRMAAGSPDRHNTSDVTVKGTATIPREANYPPGTVYDIDMHQVSSEKVERLR